MTWGLVFSVTNTLALVAWIALIALPRWPALLSAILYLGVMILCAVYVVALGLLVAGIVAPGGVPASDPNFTTISGVQSLFATRGGAVIGWTHYLAFDLFAGLWIARDADAKGFSRLVQAPVLLATFLAGPLGLLVWLIMREKRARKAGRPR